MGLICLSRRKKGNIVHCSSYLSYLTWVLYCIESLRLPRQSGASRTVLAYVSDLLLRRELYMTIKLLLADSVVKPMVVVIYHQEALTNY